LKKYDFDAPDMKETVKDHKPNFLNADKSALEAHEGYYSEEEQDEKVEFEEDPWAKKKMEDTVVTEQVGESEMDPFNLKELESAKEPETKKEDGFIRVTRAEFKSMSRKEQKKYLKRRRKHKAKSMVLMKDDSDKEDVVSSEDDDGNEELELSSEDENEKADRLATEALVSYSKSFAEEQHPKDYKIVMRKDVVDKELADGDDKNFETIEEIEIKDKWDKIEKKDQDRSERIRADRIKRMQAFQASSMAREEVIEPEDDNMEDGEVEEDEEEGKEEGNSFYASYKEAIENKEEENIEDPLKKEREKKIKEVEEDEAALKEIAIKEMTGDGEPKHKKSRTGSGSGHQNDKSKEEQHALGMGATLRMVEADKEKIEAEEERKSKEAEKSIRPDSWEAEEKRSDGRRKRGRRDPNNPTKEEVDAQQEVENLTWADRWMKNKKVKHVVQSSKMMSKVKIKMKADQKEKKSAEAEMEPEKPGTSNEAKSSMVQSEASNDGKTSVPSKRPVPTNNDLPKGMIGSLEEYAQIVGKSVSQLADAKYEPPEVSDSDSEDEQPAEGEADLWGSIMGN